MNAPAAPAGAPEDSQATDRLLRLIEEGRRANERLQARLDEATRALAAGETRLRAIIDNQPECVKLLDAQGRLIEMNPAGLRMIEADALAPLLGRDICELVAPESREAFRALTRRVCAGERGTLEYEMVGLRGTRRWLETHAVPLREEARGETLLLGITRDITERKRAERALLASEQRFRLLMENAPTLAWIKDSRLRVTWVNPQYERTTGRRRGEILGRDDFELNPPEVAARFRRQDEEVLRVQAPLQFRNLVPRGDGAEKSFLVVRFPLPDADGNPGVAGIAIDATESHQLEQAVRQLLGRLVRAQEAERHKVAEDLHDLIGQKLTALNLNLDIVRQALPEAVSAPLEPRLAQMSALLEETIASIRELMSELRPPALAEHGLTAALFQYASAFEARTGLRTQVSGPEQRVLLPHDVAIALFRIVQEALTNAAKHSGASRVRISVDKAPARVAVCVEDDGHGMRAPEGSRHDSGWGLRAMRERAEAAGGRLLVESSERGTRIIAEVPLDGGDLSRPG